MINRIDQKIKMQYGYFSCALIVLFTVYSIRIRASTLPSFLTIRNVCIAFVVIRCFLFNSFQNEIRLKKVDFNYIIFCVFEMIYANMLPILYGINVEGNLTLARMSFNYLILVAIFPLFFENTVQDTKQFARCIAIVSVVQAFICILSFMIPSIREWVLVIQEIDPTSEDFINRAYRLRNFGIGLSGAGGSMTLLCGFLGAMYSWLFIEKKGLYLFEMIIIAIGTVLIGRTGFYAEIILIVYMIMIGNLFDHNGLWHNFKMLIAIIGVIVLGFIYWVQ